MPSWIMVFVNSSNIGLLSYDENGVWYHTGTDLILDHHNCDQWNVMPKNWVIQNCVFDKLLWKFIQKKLGETIMKAGSI